jgi:hypothetical protein
MALTVDNEMNVGGLSQLSKRALGRGHQLDRSFRAVRLRSLLTPSFTRWHGDRVFYLETSLSHRSHSGLLSGGTT